MQCAWSWLSHSAAHISQARMQASIWTRSISMSWPVRLTIKREVAPQISAQSEQVRIHWRISIGSALQASAHDVHINEQYMAWRAAFASSCLDRCQHRGVTKSSFQSTSHSFRRLIKRCTPSNVPDGRGRGLWIGVQCGTPSDLPNALIHGAFRPTANI